MSHLELWPTSVSHPFSSLNSSLDFAGGKHYKKITIPLFRLVLQNFHWGSSHEGSGRHPRQHGGGRGPGRGRRFGKFAANSRRVCSLLRPSFCELIVNVMRHIDAESRAAVIRHLTAIPALSFTWRRGCRSCLFSRWRGCRSALTRVPPCTGERRASLILRAAVYVLVLCIYWCCVYIFVYKIPFNVFTISWYDRLVTIVL